MRAPLGKFEGTNYYHVTRWLYEQAGQSFLDDELGEADSFGWYGKFSGKIKGHGPFYAICNENSQGFFDVTWMKSETDLEQIWNAIKFDYEVFTLDQDEE